MMMVQEAVIIATPFGAQESVSVSKNLPTVSLNAVNVTVPFVVALCQRGGHYSKYLKHLWDLNVGEYGAMLQIYNLLS